MRFVANSVLTKSRVIQAINDCYQEHKYVRVSITAGKDRSLSQNNIAHAWYEQISRELGEDSPEGVKLECKLRFGVPILRAEDEDFCSMYDLTIGAGRNSKLSYEQKIQAMRYLPVTSLMSTKQKSRFLEDIQREYSVRNVILEFPDDERRCE